MSDDARIRLLSDPPLDGPANMGRDEALMLRVGRGLSPPTLRLYQWDPPTISLGYFQHYADYEVLPPPAGSLAVVRRPTGGGAILHDLELTYSLALPTAHPLVARNPNGLYELAHDAIIACLRELGIETARCGVTDDSGAARGPFFCFERRHCFDLLIDGDKVAGSAQRRTHSAILQHGSIVLANRFPQQQTAFFEAVEPSASVRSAGAIATERTPTSSWGSPHMDIPTTPDWFEERLLAIRRHIPTHFARTLRIAVLEAEWSSEELAAARSLTEKFAGKEWTQRT